MATPTSQLLLPGTGSDARESTQPLPKDHEPREDQQHSNPKRSTNFKDKFSFLNSGMDPLTAASSLISVVHLSVRVSQQIKNLGRNNMRMEAVSEQLRRFSTLLLAASDTIKVLLPDAQLANLAQDIVNESMHILQAIERLVVRNMGSSLRSVIEGTLHKHRVKFALEDLNNLKSSLSILLQVAHLRQGQQQKQDVLFRLAKLSRDEHRKKEQGIGTDVARRTRL